MPITSSDTLLRHLRSHARTTARASAHSGSEARARSPSTQVVSDITGTSAQAPQSLRDASSTQVTDDTLQIDALYTFDDAPDGSDAAPMSDAAASAVGWQQPLDDLLDPWFLDSGFDLAAVEADIAATMADWANPLPRRSLGESRQSMLVGPSAPVPAMPDATSHPTASSMCTRPLSCDDQGSSVHRPCTAAPIWFNRLQPFHPAPSSCQQSEQPSPHAHGVDEAYREDLSNAIEPRAFGFGIPSVEFLNTSLELYFDRFHPVFPVIHKPTFRPQRAEALLLLSICSIGSLFIGTQSATMTGQAIFERLNKAILASWEQHISRPGLAPLRMAQAALLGQTYALLSGNSNDVSMAESFHGTLASWVRTVALPLSRTNSRLDHHGMNGQSEQSWQQWVLEEEKARLVFALRIHDAEIAAMFHNCPLLRYGADPPNPIGINDALFAAADLEAWLRIRGQQQDGESTVLTSLSGSHAPRDGSTAGGLLSSTAFVTYVALESISAHVLELRTTGLLNESSKDRIVRALCELSASVDWHLQCGDHDNLGLRVLWHSDFMVMTADFDILELAIGRDGPCAATVLGQLIPWFESLDLCRCLLHALLLLERVERMSVAKEPAVHLGRGLFHASVLWAALSLRFGDTQITWRMDAMSFAEFRHLDASAMLDIWERSGLLQQHPQKVWRSLAHRSCRLLQKLGPWGLFDSFAHILLTIWDGAEIHNLGS